MLHAAWYLARLYEISYVVRNKNSHNTVDLRHLSLMSKESKVHLIYNVDSNSKYLSHSLTRAKCGTRSTLCWKILNISDSTELFAL